MSTGSAASPYLVALAGSPNAGKSALFNSLTGLQQKVGNYPGVTVEKKTGAAKTPSGKELTIIDLPGSYSLDPISVDEEISLDVLLGRGVRGAGNIPDIVVAVADAANLERTLGLILELKALGFSVIAVLNMMDIATRRGLKINLMKLTRQLGCPVIPTVAIRRQGMNELLTAIDHAVEKLPPKAAGHRPPWRRPSAEDITARFQQIDALLSEVIEQKTTRDIVSERIDRVVLHPLWGTVTLFFTLLMLFQAVFTWAQPVADAIDGGILQLGIWIKSVTPPTLWQSFLVDGILAGVGAVLVFLPQILLLFLFINLLEGSGYMMRAAFLLDHLMGRIGLQGRSFVPLLSSFACAIPGIMATRTIRSEKDRLLTILVAPLMTCSARLPVYTLLISAFIPNTAVAFGLKMQGLVMMGLFVVGIISAVVVAWVMKKVAVRGGRSPLLMELPSYKWPSLRYVATSVGLRAKAFLKKAGTYILAIAAFLWVVTTFPQPPQDYHEPAIHYSVAGRVGHFLEPAFKPLGFDWRIATGMIPGFMAREVMVSALGTVFAVEGKDEEETTTRLQEKIAAVWTIPTGLSLLAWYIFAPQCAATLVTVRRETGNWKWPVVMFAYMLLLAYAAAFLTFQLSKLWLSA